MSRRDADTTVCPVFAPLTVSLLPLMWCTQACNVAAGWGSPAQEQAPMLRVANTQPQQYPQAALPLLPEAGFPPGTPTWLKYVQAAYRVRGCVSLRYCCCWCW